MRINDFHNILELVKQDIPTAFFIFLRKSLPFPAASIKPSLLIGGPLALAAMCAVSGLLAAGLIEPQGFV